MDLKKERAKIGKNSADYRPIHPVDSRPNVGGVNVIAVLVMFEFDDFHVNMFSSERIRAIVINLSGIQLCGMIYTLLVHMVKNSLVSKTPRHVTKLYQIRREFRLNASHVRAKCTRSQISTYVHAYILH